MLRKLLLISLKCSTLIVLTFCVTVRVQVQGEQERTDEKTGVNTEIKKAPVIDAFDSIPNQKIYPIIELDSI